MRLRLLSAFVGVLILAFLPYVNLPALRGLLLTVGVVLIVAARPVEID